MLVGITGKHDTPVREVTGRTGDVAEYLRTHATTIDKAQVARLRDALTYWLDNGRLPEWGMEE